MESSTRGRADLRLPKDAAPRISYVGNLRLANLHALNPDGASDLLRWQALDVDRIDVQLAHGPPRIEASGRSRWPTSMRWRSSPSRGV